MKLKARLIYRILAEADEAADNVEMKAKMTETQYHQLPKLKIYFRFEGSFHRLTFFISKPCSVAINRLLIEMSIITAIAAAKYSTLFALEIIE